MRCAGLTQWAYLTRPLYSYLGGQRRLLSIQGIVSQTKILLLSMSHNFNDAYSTPLPRMKAHGKQDYSSPIFLFRDWEEWDR